MKGKQNAYSLQQNKKFVLDKGYSLNIFLADKKRTRKEWTENMSELLQRIREMETEDLNEWITWFSNVIRKLNEDERSTFIEQIRKGDEKYMCSSFERLLINYPSGMNVNRSLAATMFNVKQEYITVGNGAAELIRQLMSNYNEKTGNNCITA